MLVSKLSYCTGNTEIKKKRIGHFLFDAERLQELLQKKMGRRKKTEEQIKSAKREAERKRRASIKADLLRYAQHKAKEKERRQRRKEEKKTKGIADLTLREQRVQRKEWRERTRKSRLERKNRERLLERLREDSPPTDSDVSMVGDLAQNDREQSASPRMPAQQAPSPSVSSVSNSSILSRQKVTGLKIARQNRTVKDKIIERQKSAIESMKKKIHALSMKYARLEKNSKQKRVSLSPKQLRYCRNKIDVQRFLEKEENSKLCPGKKDTITRRGKKKQKRYLCDTLENLHKKYKLETNKNISYTTFTRFRPFWIVTPKVSERDTCLCTLHENFSLITDKLRQLNLIVEKTDEIIDSVVCSKYNFDCMMEKCKTCVNKMLNFATFDNSDKIVYKQWMVKTEIREIKGKEKNIKRTVKDSIECTKKDLIEKFLDMLPKFLKHKFNIWHQYQAISQLKKHLTPEEALLHVDFSENYQCKYASETQSVHFGASRQQLSLHTCVLYYCDTPGCVQTISFCSVSECLRHDAAAIYAHLKKSLKELCRDCNKNLTIRKLHVLSDGPSTQYKNKTNFYLFTQHLVHDLGIKCATWNFSESGHGKGAADGVGAVVKRTADALIAHGEDIPDFTTFVTKMLCRTNIILTTVLEADIKEADLLIPTNLKTIPETVKIHQVTWSFDNPRKLFLRQLSCTECSLQTMCSHFSTAKGFFEYPDTFSTFDLDLVNAESLHNNDERRIEQMTGSHSAFTKNRASSTLAKTKKGCQKDDLKTSAKVGSWVLVQFEGKKHTHHFVGQIMSSENSNNQVFVVKFLRKKCLESGLFVWQEPEDVSLIMVNDIVTILPEPTPTRRGELVFQFDFGKTKYFVK